MLDLLQEVVLSQYKVPQDPCDLGCNGPSDESGR